MERVLEARSLIEKEAPAARTRTASAVPATFAAWGLIALAVTFVGLMNFTIVITSRIADRTPARWKQPFVWEMTGAYTFLLLLPALLAFLERFPITKAKLATRLPLHVLVATLFGTAHTLLMWGSRTVLYRLLGWGPYDYGEMPYRFFMEGCKQVLVYAMVYATVAALRFVKRNRERELLSARLAKELTEARLSALKKQLEPHFLFNTLNMISSHVRTDPALADAMIVHLSDFLRLTLRHADDQEVPLEKEIEFLDSYLAIMKARFEDRLAVVVEAAPETRGALVPHLVLQPLVENAITHCLRDTDGAVHVRIAAAREESRLHVVVEDDGPGLPAGAAREPGRGIGLSNTAERLRHLYGDDHRFVLANRPEGGVRLDLVLPYRTIPRPA